MADGIFVAGQCLSHSFKRTRQKIERDKERRGSEWGGRDGGRDWGRERERNTHTPRTHRLATPRAVQSDQTLSAHWAVVREYTSCRVRQVQFGAEKGSPMSGRLPQPQTPTPLPKASSIASRKRREKKEAFGGRTQRESENNLRKVDESGSDRKGDPWTIHELQRLTGLDEGNAQGESAEKNGAGLVSSA
jgi:hypothetical protein